jgi:transcriptional regulator of acetoin/glycerol metabolism
VIAAADLGLAPRAVPHRAAADTEPDRTDIEAALARAKGVISQAANELGLSRQALYRRMEKLGIAPG